MQDTHDFEEGVTCKLMTKPATKPKWKPSFADINLLKKSVVSKLFFAYDEKHPSLELLSKLTYYDYPHRTLSSLPTSTDIQRIIAGTQKRTNKSPELKTKREVLEWTLMNWGGYDKVMMSDSTPPIRMSIEGGQSRGKVGLAERVESLLENCEETAEGLRWKY